MILPKLCRMSRAFGVSSIGMVSDRTGLPVETIRFYETSGLLTPKRDRSGHRRFVEADITELEVIQALRQVGMPLKDIREHLNPHQGEPEARRAVSKTLLKILDQREADLGHARAVVADWGKSASEA